MGIEQLKAQSKISPTRLLEGLEIWPCASLRSFLCASMKAGAHNDVRSGKKSKRLISHGSSVTVLGMHVRSSNPSKKEV